MKDRENTVKEHQKIFDIAVNINKDWDTAISEGEWLLKQKALDKSRRKKIVCAYYSRANNFIKVGEYESALADLDRTVKLCHQYAEAYYTRGSLYVREYYDYFIEEAIFDFTRAINLRPEYAEAYYARGLLYADAYENDQNDEAIADYQEAVKLNPDYAMAASTKYAQAYYNRGMDFDEYDEAIAYYEKAVAINSDFIDKLILDEYPTYAHAYYVSGAIFALNSKYSKAIADFQKSIKIFEKSRHRDLVSETYKYAKAYYNCGVLFVRQGKCDKAIAYFETAADIDFKYVSVYIGRSDTCTESEDHDEDFIEPYQEIRASIKDFVVPIGVRRLFLERIPFIYGGMNKIIWHGLGNKVWQSAKLDEVMFLAFCKAFRLVSGDSASSDVEDFVCIVRAEAAVREFFVKNTIDIEKKKRFQKEIIVDALLSNKQVRFLQANYGVFLCGEVFFFESEKILRRRYERAVRITERLAVMGCSALDDLPYFQAKTVKV